MGLIFILSLLFWGWAEMSAFIYIGNKLGGLITLLGVFVTAIIGIALLKNQGLSVLSRFRGDMAKGCASMFSVADSVSVVIGGVLMLIPGYVTDAIGLFLFIPGLRTFIGMCFVKWAAGNRKFSGFVNVDGTAFQSQRKQHSKTKDKTNPPKFNERRSHHRVFDDIIEGDFEERVNPQPQIQPTTTEKL